MQPKVLDRDGIEGMRVRLREWSGGVERLGNWIEGEFFSSSLSRALQRHAHLRQFDDTDCATGVGKDVWAA